MTTISAIVVEDSESRDGIRLTTLHLRYPRFIHAEFMTHRVFSRNARSSRAVPVSKMIEEVKYDPVVPLYWGKNQPGMQASEEHDALVELGEEMCDTGIGEYPSPKSLTREEAWLEARDRAVEAAQAFAAAGYHKQIVNRLLEPFMHIDTLVTATEWDNFFTLRDHPDAEPHIQMLAREIKAALEASEPRLLKDDEWHLPYVYEVEALRLWETRYGGASQREAREEWKSDLIKLSVARCARISYQPFNGDGSFEAEMARYRRLVEAFPPHASPAEHQAKPDVGGTTPELHGNFKGWIQYRKILELTHF